MRIPELIMMGLLVTGCGGDGLLPDPEPFDCDSTTELLEDARAERSRAPLFRTPDDESGRYIVTLREAAAPPSAGRAASASSELRSIAAGYGGTDIAAYPATGQFAADLTWSERRRLQGDPRVLLVEQDGRKEAWDSAKSWGLDRIDQRSGLDGQFDPGHTGDGVHVYVIDTGVDLDHPEFRGRAGESYSVFSDRGDDHGHGTHVAGTAAGASYGVCRGCVVHAVRVLRNGSGQDSWVIEGIDWATQHATANGWGAVANMSLGGDTSRSLDLAVCRSLAAGVVHAVAAGNDDRSACGYSPAHVLQALTAGATEKSGPDRRAFFSNWGPCVDLFAPGLDIESAWRGGGTRTISGTSMSSPHVAGVAALTLARHPGASPAEAKATVQANSTTGAVRDPRESPDRLLYAREDDGQ